MTTADVPSRDGAGRDSTVLDGAADLAGDGAGSDGPLGPPCAPPNQPVPTPGACQANVAVTCDGKSETLVQQLCKPDERCLEYLIEEHPNNGSVGRTFTWAACVPKQAKPCAWGWDTDASRWKAKQPAACVDNVRTRCTWPPIPKYHFPFLPRPGTETGYLLEEPCAADEFCTAGTTVGTLRCLAQGTPLCTKVGVWCEGDEVVNCTHTYEARSICALSNKTCYPGCAGGFAFCDDPGAQACDPTTHPRVCDDPKGYTDCMACKTTKKDCSTCQRLVGDTIKKVPCQCAQVYNRSLPPSATSSSFPQCIDASLTLCDPATVAESCVGTVARQCIGYWREIECAGLGQVCGVANGVAGCKEASAPSCTSTDDATCDGNELVSCCPPSGVFASGISATVHCVPGFEVRLDCDTIKPAGFYSCKDYGGMSAECN